MPLTTNNGNGTFSTGTDVPDGEGPVRRINQRVGVLKDAAVDGRIRLALAFMEAHCGEHLTVPLVAREVGLGRSHFEHLFKSHTGTTFRHEMREIRIAKGLALLADPRLRIKEVAAECGYALTRDFSRAFRSCSGSLPSQTRRS